MAKYIVREVQNEASHREGYELEAASLSTAKRIARRNQVFQGTILTIEAPNGARLAVRDADGWQGAN